MINTILTFIGMVVAGITAIAILALAFLVLGTIYIRIKRWSLQAENDPYKDPTKDFINKKE